MLTFRWKPREQQNNPASKYYLKLFFVCHEDDIFLLARFHSGMREAATMANQKNQ